MDRPEQARISMLRHAVATLVYRAAKTLREPPAGFEHFRAAPTTRSAVQILGHMADLLEWASRRVDGETEWHTSQVQPWREEIARFLAALKAFDDRLATQSPLAASPEKILQGPVADALTHVGQLATLRRMAGSGIRGESYFRADIVSGRVGMDQPPPKWKFDQVLLRC
jgi:hypothetical protein